MFSAPLLFLILSSFCYQQNWGYLSVTTTTRINTCFKADAHSTWMVCMTQNIEEDRQHVLHSTINLSLPPISICFRKLIGQFKNLLCQTSFPWPSMAVWTWAGPCLWPEERRKFLGGDFTATSSVLVCFSQVPPDTCHQQEGELLLADPLWKGR